MKHVRTARDYETLVAPGEDGEDAVTVTHAPLEVSNEKADRLVKVAASAGVELQVFNEGEVPEYRAGAVYGQRGVDLSAGVGAVSGTAEPVRTFDDPGAPAAAQAPTLEEQSATLADTSTTTTARGTRRTAASSEES